MGKQSSKVLKVKARELYEIYKDKITEEFDKNKAFLNDLHIFDYSKSDRNIVAGFLTKLKKRDKARDVS